VPLDFVEPPLPAPLVASIGRALSSEPGARFASVELFGQAISEWAKRTVWPEPERVRSRPSSEAFDPTEPAPDAPEKARAPTVGLGGDEPEKDRSSKGALRAERSDGARGLPKGALVALGGAAALFAVWLVTRSTSDETPDASIAPSPPAEPGDPRQQKSTIVPEVNAAERPLPASPPSEPLLAPSAEGPSAEAKVREPSAREPLAREPPRARTTLPKDAIPPTAPPAPASKPGASAPPLAFDRQNPYE
jgi:hypothetical protein